MQGGEIHRGCWLNDLQKGDCSKDLSIDGRIIFKWVLKQIAWENVDWIHLTKHRHWWQVVVNMIRNCF